MNRSLFAAEYRYFYFAGFYFGKVKSVWLKKGDML